MFFLKVLEKAKHYFLSSRRKVRSTHEQSMFINTLQYDFKKDFLSPNGYKDLG